MQQLNAALSEKKLKLKDLPQELREKIESHREMVIKYNMACEEYDSDDEVDEETEKKLDEQEDFIVKNELAIIEEVKAFEKPAPSNEPPAPAPAPAPPSNEPPAPAAPAPAEKKDNSVGWLIFGAAALVVTLGAVNVFKRK